MEIVVEMVNGTADCHLYYTKMDSGPYLEHLRSLTESNRVTHSRTSKLTTRCAIGALSKESGTRNLARKPCARGTRGWMQRAELAESFRMICCFCMEVLESKRTTTCNMGRRKRLSTLIPPGSVWTNEDKATANAPASQTVLPTCPRLPLLCPRMSFTATVQSGAHLQRAPTDARCSNSRRHADELRSHEPIARPNRITS